VDAVGASCAVPGVWPPVTIGIAVWWTAVCARSQRRPSAGYERVVIVHRCQGIGHMASPRRQAAALAAAGAASCSYGRTAQRARHRTQRA